MDLENNGLPSGATQLVQAELVKGERVVWLGQPAARLLTAMSIPPLLFGIPWTTFAVFWVTMAFSMTSKSHGTAPVAVVWLFPLFGLPFVMVGIGMLLSPFWLRRMARETIYLVTDHRAVIFAKGWRGYNIQSFQGDQLKDLYRVQKVDGSGDLVFERRLSRRRYGRQTTTTTTTIGFLGIPNVKAIEDLVRATADRYSESPKVG